MVPLLKLPSLQVLSLPALNTGKFAHEPRYPNPLPPPPPVVPHCLLPRSTPPRKELKGLIRVQRMKRPLASYMACVQTDITGSMRAILTDWLVEVAQEYKLKPDTLFLCMALVDRYLSVRRVQRNRRATKFVSLQASK